MIEATYWDLGVERTKVCRVCGIRKSVKEFYNKTRRCKPCWCARSKAYYEKDIDKNRERHRMWYHGRADEHRDATYKRKYGISSKIVDGIIEMQGGKCKCCGIAFIGRGTMGTAPVIDHCHKGGHMRGVICQRCNKVEGQMGSIDVARKVLEYMEKNELWYQCRELTLEFRKRKAAGITSFRID